MEYKLQLIEAFKMVLSGDKQLMDQGTEFLNQQKLNPQYASTLMVLIDTKEQGLHERQFAITQLKEVIEKKWKGSEKYPGLQEDIKTQIKSNIVEAMIRVADTRKLYKTYEKIIYKIAQLDFPQKWPGVIEQLNQIFETSDDFTILFGCLSTLRAILQVFEYQLGEEDRAPLEQIVKLTFPHLIKLASKIYNNYSDNTGILMQVLLKIFYLGINLDLPRYFQDFKALNDWIEFFKSVYKFQLPEQYTNKPANESDIMALNKVIFWKNKKIVGKIFMRIFQKYANEKFESDSTAGLAKYLMENHAHKLIDIILEMLTTSLTHFVSLPTLHFSMRSVQMALRIESLVQYLSPKLSEIAIHICVPILALNEKDRQLFVTDPIEFMRKEEDFSATMYNPKNAAMDLIETIIKKNNNKHLLEVMQFFYKTLSENQMNGQPLSMPQKDGILWAFGEMFSDIIKNEQLKDNIEQILQNFVLPLHNAPEPYIRSRICWLYGIYGCLEYKNTQTVQHVTTMMCQAINDKNLVIKTKAAIAINKFIQQKIAKEIIRIEVKKLIEIYIKLMEDVDSEDLVHALEGIIGNYSEEVKDFSVGLIEQLMVAFYRYDEKEGESDEMYGEGEFAAAQCLNAINKILVSDLAPSVYTQLEILLIPLMQYTLQDESDYLEEGLDMIALIVQKTPKISEKLYFFFLAISYMVIGINDDVNIDAMTILTEDQKKVMEAVRAGWGAEFTPKLLPAIKNFIQKDPEFFLSQKDFFGKSFIELMFLSVEGVIQVSSKTEVENDMANILHYFIALIENNIGKNSPLIDEIVLKITESSLNYLNTYQKDFPQFGRNCYIVICTAMIYNVELVLQLLDNRGILKLFFEHLFKQFTNKKAAKDNTDLDLQKVLMGLTSILKIQQAQMPKVMEEVFKDLMKMYTEITSLILEVREQDIDEDEEDEDDDDLDFFEKVDYNDKYETPFDSIDELIAFEEQLEQIKNTNEGYFNGIFSLLDNKDQQKLKENIQEARKQYNEYKQAQQEQQQQQNQ